VQGFFKKSELNIVEAPMSRIPKCQACGLWEGCKSPKMPVYGKGRRKIIIVGEAPGADEDTQGKPFVGATGQVLRTALLRLGIEPGRDTLLTNALICRPPRNEIRDEVLVEHCRPNLIKTIEEHQPEVIVPLGKIAVKSVLGWLWKEDVKEIGRWVGWQIPCQKLNAWICPTYHPSFLLRSKDPVVERYFEQHLEAAVNLGGRPWKVVPNFRDKIQVCPDPEDAANLIRAIIDTPGTIAFDYETDRLKPDNKEARIICASVCWEGKETIAFPWHGPVIEAMSKLLQSRQHPKIGYNAKFEDRWTNAKLGIRVRGWVWDGMLAAHVLDNRPDITGLKFQAFVLLGQEPYNKHLESLLKPKDGGGGNAKNQISDIELRDLMLYCGMDSLLEFKVGKLQMEAVGA
jgi:uracil-DNA glycosylase family 4